MKYISKKDIVFPKRKSSSHKGDNGKVLVIGGSYDYVGAPVLAGLAALRSGCDWVTLALPEKVGWAAHCLTKDLVVKKFKGNNFSLFFKQQEGFTNITIITNDSPSLLSRLCGAISINDLNIHDARIFTRTDGIIIDSFNVTDFRTHQAVDKEKFDKIRKDIELAANLKLHITKEFNKVRSKWKILENKLFGRKGKIKIEFEEHKKYTIIDVFSPDRLGLLYNITTKFYELGISIYLAKISTKGDDVVDTFYVLRNNGKKIGQYDYELIRVSLIDSLTELI